MKSLLIVTAVIEVATGLALLVSPSLVVSLLLGAELDAPAALVVARVGGAALLSIGAGSWLARNDTQSGAATGLIASLLLYNIAAAAVLAYSGMVLSLAGIVLWPAAALHVALALWCGACLRGRQVRPLHTAG